jgi:flagellar hook assembly protein FlgD
VVSTVRKSGGISLVGAYPNPARSEARIDYRLDAAMKVAIRITDVGGRVVRVLDQNMESAGTHTLRWNCRDAAGRPVPDGVYFYTLKAGNNTETRTLRVAR